MKKLTIDQANLLDKIARKSGMDCWFKVHYDLCHIRDMENHKTISLKRGIKDLDEGLTDLEDYYLTDEEIKLYQETVRQILGGK